MNIMCSVCDEYPINDMEVYLIFENSESGKFGDFKGVFSEYEIAKQHIFKMGEAIELYRNGNAGRFDVIKDVFKTGDQTITKMNIVEWNMNTGSPF